MFSPTCELLAITEWLIDMADTPHGAASRGVHRVVGDLQTWLDRGGERPDAPTVATALAAAWLVRDQIPSGSPAGALLATLAGPE